MYCSSRINNTCMVLQKFWRWLKESVSRLVSKQSIDPASGQRWSYGIFLRFVLVLSPMIRMTVPVGMWSFTNYTLYVLLEWYILRDSLDLKLSDVNVSVIMAVWSLTQIGCKAISGTSKMVMTSESKAYIVSTKEAKKLVTMYEQKRLRGELVRTTMLKY